MGVWELYFLAFVCYICLYLCGDCVLGRSFCVKAFDCDLCVLAFVCYVCLHLGGRLCVWCRAFCVTAYDCEFHFLHLFVMLVYTIVCLLYMSLWYFIVNCFLVFVCYNKCLSTPLW